LHKDIYRERIGRQGGTGFLMVWQKRVSTHGGFLALVLGAVRADPLSVSHSSGPSIFFLLLYIRAPWSFFDTDRSLVRLLLIWEIL
jgi:hypothetical protein